MTIELTGHSLHPPSPSASVQPDTELRAHSVKLPSIEVPVYTQNIHTKTTQSKTLQLHATVSQRSYAAVPSALAHTVTNDTGYLTLVKLVALCLRHAIVDDRLTHITAKQRA